MSLSTGQAKALRALLLHPKIEDAAAAAGVSTRTVFRYLDDPEFQAELKTAQDKAIDTAVASLAVAASTAVQTLIDIQTTEDAPYAVRVSAARAILGNVVRLIEMRDLTARVAEIEKQIEGLR